MGPGSAIFTGLAVVILLPVALLGVTGGVLGGLAAPTVARLTALAPATAGALSATTGVTLGAVVAVTWLLRSAEPRRA